MNLTRERNLGLGLTIFAAHTSWRHTAQSTTGIMYYTDNTAHGYLLN